MLFCAQNKEENSKVKNALVQGSKFSVCAVLAVTLLSVISGVAMLFLPDFHSNDTLIKTIEALVFPLICIGIATKSGGSKALACGLTAGVIVQKGYSLTASCGVQGISGIGGCIAAGFLSAYAIGWSEKLWSKITKKQKTNAVTTETTALIIAGISGLLINEISTYINSLVLLTLTLTGGKNLIASAIFTGMFMGADVMGPLHLGGYLYSCAAFATGDTQALSSTLAASAVPALSVFVFSMIYPKKMTATGKLCALCALAGEIFGVKISAAAFYTEKPLRMVAAWVPGGCVASTLCALLRCNSTSPNSAISIVTQQNPLYFLLGIVCGTLISIFIMSMLLEPKEQENTEKTTGNLLANTV